MKNALLVFGGNSFEHDISIITALIVYKNSMNCDYNLLPVYISKNEEWFFYDKKDLSINHFKDFDSNYKSLGFKKMYFKSGQNSIFYKKGLKEKKIDVCCALSCCHGGMGEDGRLVSILESYNIPVSCGSHVANAICMDKVLSKNFFLANKIPSLPFFNFRKSDFDKDKDFIYKKLIKFGFPVILKPASLGSSIGIEVVKNIDDFEKAVKIVFEFDEHVLVERAVLKDMKEFNVAVFKDQNKLYVSKIDLAVKTDEILSFKDKYISNNKQSSQKTPSKISGQKGGGYLNERKIDDSMVDDKIKYKMKRISEELYTKLSLKGVVRIDFIVDRKNRVYVNEINTTPGSLGYYFFVPCVFKTMSEFITKLMDYSVFEFNNRLSIKKEFITKLI